MGFKSSSLSVAFFWWPNGEGAHQQLDGLVTQPAGLVRVLRLDFTRCQ